MFRTNGVIPRVTVETFITRRREGGKKERCSTINSPHATRCSLLVDHVIEESKRRRRVKHVIGAQIRGKIRSMTLPRLFRALKRTRETRINSDKMKIIIVPPRSPRFLKTLNRTNQVSSKFSRSNAPMLTPLAALSTRIASYHRPK